ncbi:uncharacterized protein Dmoj_GI26342, isoform A [Drosophila mojavensis]|uniref:Uncharacterized protein, isoform A n=1 Tax=Drosophila mojavensis TaxID=7230 RepID=A0A0Q9WMR9_DROMO|nr:uncharacterized protein Dmoj_GI26342, isoform A [Drosophila mojavensis]
MGRGMATNVHNELRSDQAGSKSGEWRQYGTGRGRRLHNDMWATAFFPKVQLLRSARAEQEVGRGRQGKAGGGRWQLAFACNLRDVK